MITDSRQNSFQELPQVVLRDQPLFQVLQQGQVSPIAAEEDKSFPERRDQRDGMLQQQHRGHHHRRNCRRIDRPKKFTAAPDDGHYTQGGGSYHGAAHDPFKQAAFHNPVGPGDAKKGHRICHDNDQTGNK